MRRLEPGLIATLGEHGMAFGPSVQQSFSPYLGGTIFITSDSLLNGFHVLLEDSVRTLELHRAIELQPRLEELLTRARQIAAEGKMLTPTRAAKALIHLQRVLDPALLLTGGSDDLLDSNLRPEINEQAALLRKASGIGLPSWLAPADPETLQSLDYGRCKPVGLYADTARLSSYFAAVRWLQLIPLRATREHEFDALVLFSLCLSDETLGLGPLGKWFHSFNSFFGQSDDPGPNSSSPPSTGHIPRTRITLMRPSPRHAGNSRATSSKTATIRSTPTIAPPGPCSRLSPR